LDELLRKLAVALVDQADMEIDVIGFAETAEHEQEYQREQNCEEYRQLIPEVPPDTDFGECQDSK
jgi:hypothetical protein